MTLKINGELTPEQIKAGNERTDRLNTGIPVDTLNTTISNIVIPQPDPITGIIPSTNPVYMQPTTTPDPSKAMFDSYMSELNKADAGKPSSVEAYKLAEEQAGITQKQNEVGAINQEIADINAKAQAEILKQTGRMTDVGRIGGTQRAIERNTAIQVLPLQARALIAQNNLTEAQNKLSTLFKLQSDDADRAYNTKIKTIDAVYNFASKAEQAKLDALKETEAIKRDEIKSLQDYKNKIAASLIDNGQANLIGELTSADTMDKVNAVAGKIKASATGGLTPAQINTTVNAIAGAFDNEPIVKNFNVIAEGKTFVDSLSNKTVNPADDQALIYALAKALDPNSVVREGEYATAQKYSQSLINAYGSSIKQAIAGTGFLSETARKNIKNTIDSRYNASLKSYTQVRNEYQRQMDDARAGKARSITEYTTPQAENTNNFSNLSNEDLLKQTPNNTTEEKLGEIDTRGFFAKLLGL